MPIGLLSISSDQLGAKEIRDLAYFNVRNQIASIPGISFGPPLGGKVRQITVFLDQQRLLARGVSPSEVVKAINSQSAIIPAGDIKIGDLDYYVYSNSLIDLVDKINDIPIKVVNGTPTTLASAAFPVLPASWYQLRLDAVGDRLRAYVNGALLLETTDGALPEGGGWRREEPDRQTGQDNEVAHRLSEACNWRPRSPHGIARVSWTDDGVSRRRPPNPARISPWWRSGASSERG